MIYLTDGTYDGLLSAIFLSYAQAGASRPIQPTHIIDRALHQENMFEPVFEVKTDAAMAARVISGVERIAGATANRLLLKIFLSEFSDANLLVYRLVKKIMALKRPDFLKNYADPDVLRAAQISKMINREVHRMHAFVRFQKLQSGEYLALVDPDFDVMPLLDDHFVRRFADMAWTIFDTRRGYGIYFDKTTVVYVQDIPVDFDESAKIEKSFLDENEIAFQSLWKAYFDAVNIAARKNDKHHIRQLPKRYWKYLSEKDVVDVAAANSIHFRNR